MKIPNLYLYDRIAKKKSRLMTSTNLFCTVLGACLSKVYQVESTEGGANNLILTYMRFVNFPLFNNLLCTLFNCCNYLSNYQDLHRPLIGSNLLDLN